MVHDPRQRDDKGRLLPGVILNPGGRPKRPTQFSRASIMELCDERGYHPVEAMIDIAREPGASAYIRLEVAKEIMSYMAAKVKQVQITNAEGDGDGQIRISWDVSPQAVENARQMDTEQAEQFEKQSRKATRAILNGIAEAVLNDDEDDQSALPDGPEDDVR